METNRVDSSWYVWVVKSNRFENLKYFIESNVPEVEEILYPTVTGERKLKSKIKKFKTPLYSGYVFLRYSKENEIRVHNLLINHYTISSYIGNCTARDVASVNSLQKVEHLNLEEVKEFCVGDKVRVNGGFFKDYIGLVTDVSSNYIRVNVETNINKLFKVVFSPDDLDIVDRM